MDSQDYYNNSTEDDDDDESQHQQQHHCDDDDDDDWLLPSCARKTAKGGYAHTWNKSSSDFQIWMHVQATHNAATEVQECLQFMQETREKLQSKMKVARTQAVPLKRHLEPSST